MPHNIYTTYRRIMDADTTPYERDRQLSALMSSMEREYHIPALYDPTWEREHRTAASLYHIISNSRELN